MVTSVGTEDRFDELLKHLVELEHDAIDAYEACIERLDEAIDKSKMQEFLGDHHRHLEELEKVATVGNIDLPEKGSMKRYLTTGKVAFANLLGDGALLKAMKTNEDDTVEAYERATQHTEVRPETRELFERAHQDELRHRAWMAATAETK
jgi:rubrerythrin